MLQRSTIIKQFLYLLASSGSTITAKYCQQDMIDEKIRSNAFPKIEFYAKKGDLFIWHANLLHGGTPILDKNSTRKSMVMPNFAKDVIKYHDYGKAVVVGRAWALIIRMRHEHQPTLFTASSVSPYQSISSFSPYQSISHCFPIPVHIKQNAS
jgi:hypothetical protein